MNSPLAPEGRVAPPASMDINDHGIDWEVAQNVEVLLDGVVQRRVLAYDCQVGSVRRHATHPATGQPRLDPLTGSLAVEEVTGHVTVRWRDKSAATDLLQAPTGYGKNPAPAAEPAPSSSATRSAAIGLTVVLALLAWALVFAVAMLAAQTLSSLRP